MSNNTSLSRPISVAKVAASLGVVSGDVGTLCTSSKINKSSLRKPTWVGLDPTKVCDASLKLEDKKPTGSYENVGFGLFVPYCRTVSDILATSTKPWFHAAPTTANDNYKCLAHFEGYDHGAKLTSVCGSFSIAEDAEVTFFPSATEQSTAVGFENIPFFTGDNKYYYGCEVYVNGKWKKRVVSTTPIGSTSTDTPDSPITEAVLHSGYTAKQGDEIKIVVFVANADGKTDIENNGQVATDKRYYSCAFAEGVVTSESKTVPSYSPYWAIYKESGEYILEFTNPHPTKAIKPFTVVVKLYGSDGNSATSDGFVANVEFKNGVAAGETVQKKYLDPGYPIRFCTHNVFYVNSTSAIEVQWPDVYDDVALPAT